ncbi:YozE family protein [Companilactobacillus sp.]|uniref:YozE family protein n=1 Tax=Companilactobacillus sp. TaxID=2767905 RepID=UPI00260AF658|nr:YozE family protein [Companilactobacillus sp.]
MEIIDLSFFQWLQKFIDVDLPIGDLSKDAKADNNFPRESKDKTEIIDYLETKSANYRVIQVAEESFDFYKSSFLSDDFSGL